MPVTLGILYDNTATGWTDIQPAGTPGYLQDNPASSSTLIICVDSTGLDPGDSGYDPTKRGSLLQPFRSLNYARTQLRFGGGQPDWILIKMGDIQIDQDFYFNNGIRSYGNTSGGGVINPFVIAGYDPAKTQVVSGKTIPLVYPYGSSLGASTFGRTVIQPVYQGTGMNGGTAGTKTGGTNYTAYLGLEIRFPWRNPTDTNNWICQSQTATVSNASPAIVTLPVSNQTGWMGWGYSQGPRAGGFPFEFKNNGDTLPIDGATGLPIAFATTYYLTPITTTRTANLTQYSNVVTLTSGNTTGLNVGAIVYETTPGSPKILPGFVGEGTNNQPRILAITGPTTFTMTQNAMNTPGTPISLTITGNTFNISSTSGGSFINTSGTNTGTHIGNPPIAVDIVGSPTGFVFGGYTDWALCEDCICDYAASAGGFAGSPYTTIGVISDTMQIRRCHFRYTYTVGGGFGGAATSIDVGVFNNLKIHETMVDHTGWIENPSGITAFSGAGFSHDIYQHPDGPYFPCLPNLFGNIFARSAQDSNGNMLAAVQLRGGAVVDNNLYVAAHGIMSSHDYVGHKTIVHNNCLIEGNNGIYTYGYAGYDNSDHNPHNLGNGEWYKNIIANKESHQGGVAFQIAPGFNDISVHDNIVFNCFGTQVTQIFNSILSWTITNGGTGYGDLRTTFTGISPTNPPSYTGYTITGVADTSNMIAGGNVGKVVGTTFDPSVDGVWAFNSVTSTTAEMRYPPLPSPGSVWATDSGTVWPSVDSIPLTVSSGTIGTGGKASFIPVSGVLDSMAFCQVGGGSTWDDFGRDYSDGNIAHGNNPATRPQSILTCTFNGGTGAQIRVDSVAYNTDIVAETTNHIDTNGSTWANYPGTGFPGNDVRNVSAANYYASIGNPRGFPSTMAGFCDACAQQSKNNWDSRLTADAANNAIRIAFGMGGTPPPPPPPPSLDILLGQAML